MRSTTALLVLMIVATAPGIEPVEAGIYTFKDSHGILHYTNQPSDPAYARMHLVGYRPDTKTKTQRRSNPEQYRAMIEQVAREYQVDHALLHAVIHVESNYDPKAVSRRGAVGLMQLMPHTARRLGVTNSYDPVQNVRGGARYLRDLLAKYNNDLILTLAAYNAGEEAVAQHGNRIPPYRETWAYVPRVLEIYRRHQPGEGSVN